MTGDPAGWIARRVLVVVAHPDDEALGCGALLAELQDARILFVTDGAPRDGADAVRHGFETPAAYAAARRREAEAALELAGIGPARIVCLNVPDQQAPLHLVEVARALAPWMDQTDVVLTHAFEGGHGDHDAVAFAVAAAIRLAGHRPSLVEMPFYHAGPEGWRRQRFLTAGGAGPEQVRALDSASRDLKRRMFAAYRTQAETLAGFDQTIERFRAAPAYDFRERPHGGPLLYEQHGWKLTWSDWQARVAAAETELGPERISCR